MEAASNLLAALESDSECRCIEQNLILHNTSSGIGVSGISKVLQQVNDLKVSIELQSRTTT